MPRQLRKLKYLVLGTVVCFLVGALALPLPGKLATHLENHAGNRVGSAFVSKLANQLSLSSQLAANAQPTPEPSDGPSDDSNGRPLPGDDMPGRPIGPNGEGNDAADMLRPFEEVTGELEKQEGLFTTYSDLETGKTYISLLPGQLNQNFLLAASIESGVGEAGLFRGWPINDLLIQFREAPENKLQVLVPNTFIRNPDGQNWQQRLQDTSFSDSVLFLIDVVSIEPDSQAKLIDLSNLIVTRDLANIKDSLGPATEGYSQNSELSRISSLKVFEKNLEMGLAASYTSDGGPAPFSLGMLFGPSLRNLPDDRGFSLGIRYSLSALPTANGYEPRVADERVGYFVSTFRSSSQVGRSDPFVRYIHRWHLEKQNPTATLSQPKEPIVFWLENTIPPEYRESLKAGVLSWNKAFEQAGFQDAIEVKQMPNNADWDPADVRYNVIRWSDSLSFAPAGFGPSRVNPLTGEILDADVILDANNIRLLRQQYRSFASGQFPDAVEAFDTAALRCGLHSHGQNGHEQNWVLQWRALQQFGMAGLNYLQTNADELSRFSQGLSQGSEAECYQHIGAQKAAFGAVALQATTQMNRAQLDDYVQQFLVMLAAHEVGHTLGLRHNFAGSNLLAPEQLNDSAVTSTQGLSNSIMDYFPPNIAPPGTPQGDFFPTQVGAYDAWAIQYGYQPVAAFPTETTVVGNQPAKPTLRQIADRGNEPDLAYAPDEDIFDFIDPEVNAWDFSNNPLQFSEWQMDNAQAVWQRLNRLSVGRDEGYGGLRSRVSMVFRYFASNAATLTDYVGGQRFRRLDPWERVSASGVNTPLEPVETAKQREALSVLNEKVFAADAFQFSSQLLNQLPPDRWSTPGSGITVAPLDYPIYDEVLTLQGLTLTSLLQAPRLARIRDLEYKGTSNDVLTIAELFNTVYEGIWTEVALPPTQQRAGRGEEETAVPTGTVSSLRRGLQRHHLQILSNLVLKKGFESLGEAQSLLDFVAILGNVGAPEDARLLARYQLGEMYDDVGSVLRRQGGQMDITTKAHWEDIRDRISRVLDAPLSGT